MIKMMTTLHTKKSYQFIIICEQGKVSQIVLLKQKKSFLDFKSGGSRSGSFFTKRKLIFYRRSKTSLQSIQHANGNDQVKQLNDDFSVCMILKRDKFALVINYVTHQSGSR